MAVLCAVVLCLQDCNLDYTTLHYKHDQVLYPTSYTHITITSARF